MILDKHAIKTTIELLSICYVIATKFSIWIHKFEIPQAFIATKSSLYTNFIKALLDDDLLSRKWIKLFGSCN